MKPTDVQASEEDSGAKEVGVDPDAETDHESIPLQRNNTSSKEELVTKEKR